MLRSPLLPVLMLVGPGVSSLPAQTVPAALPGWILVDSASHAVHLTLTVTGPTDSGSASLEGHRRGDVQIVVPVGWTVRWSWLNADSSATHSLVVMAEREKLPLEGGRPVFDNAMTRMVTAGLKPGQKDETTFVADEAGWYWMLCGVPGHAVRGEWIGLKVDREAREVSVRDRQP